MPPYPVIIRLPPKPVPTEKIMRHRKFEDIIRDIEQGRRFPPGPREPIIAKPPAVPTPDIPFPIPEPIREVPQPSIPAPGPVRQPPPLPLPQPRAPSIPTPAPQPPRRASPLPRQRVIRAPGVTIGTAAASILRPILRRRPASQPTVLSEFLRGRAFDPVLNRPGEAFDPLPATQPSPQPVRPITGPLTPDNALALTLQPQATGQRRGRREKECECEETEEEKELNRRPSSVLAKVKAFTRRMSQNSLDNLRN